MEILHDEPSRFGIEMMNLYGTIERGKDDAALRLQNWLTEDKEQRRFSVVFFDDDLKLSLKAIQRQAELDNIVGSVARQHPDFEFANFTLEELVEVAAEIAGDCVRSADWTGINKGKDFENKYRSITSVDLKGEQWGRRLAAYALKHPRRAGSKEERQLLQHVRAAMHAWMSNYDVQRELFEIDPVSLEQRARTNSVG